jgi:hypothetical protein
MPEITLLEKPNYTGIQLAEGDIRIGLWGPMHQGNLSLKTLAVHGDPVLLAAFDDLDPMVWNKPESTPHGGTGYYQTKTGISRGEAVDFLGRCGYTLAGGENNPPPGAQEEEPRPIPPPPPVGGLSLGLSELAAHAGDFDRIRGLFSERNRFYRYRPGANEKWPLGRGVYVIWQNQPGGDAMIYIGKTGGYGRDDQGAVIYGGGTFAQRASRWHPYSFTRKGVCAGHFEYAPNASVNTIRKLPEAERYQKQLPFSSITVDCYLTDGIEHQVSPSFLEALLLQTYLARFNSLPVANNEF